MDVDGDAEGDTAAPPIVHMERTNATDIVESATSQEVGNTNRNQSMRSQTVSGMRRRRATKDNVIVDEDREDSTNGKKSSANKKMDTVLTGIVGMPSSEIREAAKCFTLAVDQALALVSATSRVDLLLHNATPSDPPPQD